jgi:hypothetical protein
VHKEQAQYGETVRRRCNARAKAFVLQYGLRVFLLLLLLLPPRAACATGVVGSDWWCVWLCMRRTAALVTRCWLDRKALVYLIIIKAIMRRPEEEEEEDDDQGGGSAEELAIVKEEVVELVYRIMEAHLKDQPWSEASVPEWISRISSEVLKGLTDQQRPYKFAGACRAGWAACFCAFRVSAIPLKCGIPSAPQRALPVHLGVEASLPFVRPFGSSHASHAPAQLSHVTTAVLVVVCACCVLRGAVTTMIMQNNGAGVHSATSQFWDTSVDGVFSVSFPRSRDNKTPIYAICTVGAFQY